MYVWEVLLIVSVVFISTEFIVRLVKIGTRYSENMARIKHGYPTLDNARPIDAPPETYSLEHRMQ